jgi:hypothetical protein
MWKGIGFSERKEKIMPRRDGTGPMGQGSMTGRGLGNCVKVGIPAVAAGAALAYGLGRRAGWFGKGRGLGMGFGRGFLRGFGFGVATEEDKNAELLALKEEEKRIQERISELEKQ